MTTRRDRFLAVVGTALGFGYSPVVPGTVGTLPAVGIFVLIVVLAPPGWNRALIGVALILSCALSVALGAWAERYWGRKDPRNFVLDEVAGYLLTVLLFQSSSLLVTVCWTFLASRAFDIIKPWPASRIEALGGGWGILLDDLVASLYATAFLHLVAYLFPKLLPV